MTTQTQESRHLQRLLSFGNVELRCIDKIGPLVKKQPVIWSGVYDDYDSMRKSILYAERSGMDTYTTINPTAKPATNGKIQPFKKTTKDRDIEFISTIFFDFDPENETGSPADDHQINLARCQAEKLAEFLSGEKWGEPLFGFSGNGAHLMYTTNLEVENVSCLTGLYKALEKRFSTDEIIFDVVVRNPARIARLYGTTNRKGGRRASCVFSDGFTPGPMVTGLSERLTPTREHRAWVKPPKPESFGKFIKNLDVVALFRNSGMYLCEGDGFHHVECPWASSHTGGSNSASVWEGEWPQFNCFHSHCDGKNISDVIGYFGE